MAQPTLIFRPTCDSIIFDLDGTLWDASSTTAEAWSKTATELGLKITISEQDVKSVSGLPFDQCVEKLFGLHAHSISELNSLLDKSEKIEILNKGGRFYEGMLEGLRELSVQYRLFLVSNCQQWYLDAFFDHSGLREIFEDSLCYGQTQKPKSENVKEIVKRNNIKKAVYVGDTHWDQEAAFFAQVKFIFASFGFGSVSVACPSVGSIAELVRSMKSPKEDLIIQYRKLSQNEFKTAEAYYQSVGYTQTIQVQNKFFAAFHQDEMIGLVRLAFENQYWVLRGMQIRPAYQFFGVGTQLIKLLESELGNELCFCIPHGWLRNFYGQIDFQKEDDLSQVPPFLLERLIQLQKKYPQLILMKREAKLR